jgi:hypothetical protein
MRVPCRSPPSGVAPDQQVVRRPHLLHRHLHHDARARVDRQEGRVGRPPLRPQRGQDHAAHRLVPLGHAEQRGVEAAGAVVVGGGGELVVEAEGVEEGAQPRVVVGAEALVRAEGVGDGGERLAEMPGQRLPVRHVVRHLPQPVHVVAEGEEAGRQAGQPREGAPHPGRARDFPEGADVRQAGGAVPGLEQRFTPAGGAQALGDLRRLLERPCLGQVRAGMCRITVHKTHKTIAAFGPIS